MSNNSEILTKRILGTIKEYSQFCYGDDRSKLEIDFNFNALNNKFSVNLFLDEECFAGGCDENLEKALEFTLIDTEKEINLDSDYREYNHKLDLVGAYLDEKR